MQPLESRRNGQHKVTTIIGTSVALGKRLPPFNGAKTASADIRKQIQYRRVERGGGGGCKWGGD